MSKPKGTPLRWECAGGCGKFQLVRKARVDQDCEVYLCNMGGPCQSKIARPVDGRVWTWVFNACGSFYGVKFVWPDAESIAAAERAREILYAGLAQVAIGKAMRKD